MNVRLLMAGVFLIFHPFVMAFDGNSYETALKAHGSKNDSVLSSEEGEIDGEKHLIVVTQRETGPYVYLFKRESELYKGIGRTKIPTLQKVSIKNNSLFLELSFCHHGCSDTRYQFKRVAGNLRLVGVDLQNETWCSYYDGKNALPDCNYSVRSGNSYNLLASESVCWAEELQEGKELKINTKPYQPRGLQHRITFSKVDLPLFDGFVENNSLLPKSCYFDSKKKIHIYEPKP